MSEGARPVPPAGPRSRSPAAALRRTPPRDRTPLSRLVAVALVADLLFAGGLSVAFFPVATGTTALASYEALPEGLQGLLGEPKTGTREARGTTDLASRGPVHDWLTRFLADAAEGDAEAQASLPLGLDANRTTGTWLDGAQLEVEWIVYGEPLTYQVWVAAPEVRTDAVVQGAPDRSVTALDRTSLTLSDGEWDVLVASRVPGSATPGSVERIGPFWVDAVGPPAPVVEGGRSTLTFDTYQLAFSWTTVDDLSGLGGWVVEQADGKGVFAPVVRLDPDETSFTALNVANGDYRFRVRAVNGAGAIGAPSVPLTVTVDAQGGLEPPGPGQWDFGIHAVYHSVLHVYDISDPSAYVDLATVAPGGSYGRLSAHEYTHYTGSGWGIETEDAELQAIVAQVVGDETNSLEIGKLLFAWLFDATDYDFDKFNSPDGGNFQRASETLDRGLGICGDLSALYVTMMRIAGVPARPVHGYLLNRGENAGVEGIGGFHMWAEIHVGGDDGVGEGWLPVDVSGVTGTFEPKHLDIYFGVANPDYLQLGVQEDLGDDDLPLEDGKEPARNRWNVWANLGWSYKDEGGAPPDLIFTAETELAERDTTQAWLWFDPETHERRVCPAEDTGCADGLRYYYPDLNWQSERAIDYGATVQWDDDRVREVTVVFRYPEQAAPNQAVIFTPYTKGSDCQGHETLDPQFATGGFIEWVVAAPRSACPT